jgi:septum formation protein
LTTSPATSLVLASSSPRRRQLLSQLGIPLTIDAPRVDERALSGEQAPDFARRVARLKGEAIAPAHPEEVVLAADTAVAIEGELFGKPRDAADALRMLRELSGREHQVVTGVVAIGPAGQHQQIVSTRVRMRVISEREAVWYVGTGEPMDKAGAYAIQERGGMFVTSIEGSFSNVVGLPLVETLALLAKAGLELPF